MARTKAERWQAKHAFFVQDFNDIWSAAQMERRQAVADRRFYSILGAQYEDALGEQFENTPRFEYNKVHQSVIRIFNEYRNNRISVMFRPDDADSSSETAETMTGRYRADEQKSNAQEAYDNAFEESVGGGMGAFRYRCVADVDEDEDETKYKEGDEDTPLRVAIEPIHDADTSVFFNLDAKRQDKADAKRCYVIYSISRRAYEADPAYKNFSVASFQKPTGATGTYFDWCTPDVIYLVDVYEVETKGAASYVYQSRISPDADEVELDEDEQKDAQKIADLQAQGYFHARTERITRRQIHKWRANGCEIMEDCGIVPGRWIPIVVTYGKRWYVDNIERFMGQVRLQKDMQRLLNMMISWLAEIASLTPMEVPILTPQQVAGHQTSWAEGNITRAAYRLVNPIKDKDGNLAPPTMIPTLKPPEVPPVLASLMQVCVAAMDQLGGDNAQEPDMASNISGKAVELITKRIDMQSFIFTDNFGKAMQHGGRVWLSMQKDIMPEGAYKAAIVKPDGTRDFADMSVPGQTSDGKHTTLNDPRVGRYGPIVDVGPSFISRRDATVRALTGMLSIVGAADPAEATVLAAAIIMNMDGEGLEDLKAYYRRKLVQMGAVEPTDEEKAELEKAQANQQPDANAQFLLGEAKKSLALAEKAQADAALSRAKLPNVAADTVKKLHEANATDVDAQLAVHNALNPAPPAGAAQPEPATT